MVEERRGHVQVSVATARAQVHDGGGGGLAVGRDLDLLEALGTRVTAAVLRGVERDDKVRIGRVLTARTETWKSEVSLAHRDMPLALLTGGVVGGSSSKVSLDRGGGGKGSKGSDGDSREEHFDVCVKDF